MDPILPILPANSGIREVSPALGTVRISPEQRDARQREQRKRRGRAEEAVSNDFERGDDPAVEAPPGAGARRAPAGRHVDIEA